MRGMMSVDQSIHVSLTEPLMRYVRDKVADGEHLTASDVVRVALETLVARDRSEFGWVGQGR